MKRKVYLSDRFREWREQRAYTRADMAYIISTQLDTKVSTSLVQKWELRERDLEPDLVLRISKVLDVTAEELTYEQER